VDGDLAQGAERDAGQDRVHRAEASGNGTLGALGRPRRARRQDDRAADARPERQRHRSVGGDELLDGVLAGRDLRRAGPSPDARDGVGEVDQAVGEVVVGHHRGDALLLSAKVNVPRSSTTARRCGWRRAPIA
jgi:hypothetical protein